MEFTDFQIGIMGCVALVLLLLASIPIGVSLITVSVVGIALVSNWNVAWSTLGLTPYNFATDWVLASVPAFLFMGYIAYHANITQGLFSAASVWLQRVPGGLAVASIFGCAGFSAITGSSVACAAAMGRVAIPEMVRHKYDIRLATGTIAAGGTIGALIPPSILFILYGVIAQVPIGKLFLGGAIVGLLSVVLYSLAIIIQVYLRPEWAPRQTESATFRDKIRALGDTAPVILIALGIFGGMGIGMFTPTEAGAVGSVLVCLVALFKRSLSYKAVHSAVVETVITTGSIFIIAVGASLFARFLALSGVPLQISTFVNGLDAPLFFILLAIVILYLVVGMFLEPIGAMLLTMPILLPIINELNLSLIWFGILLVKLLEVGMITPPVGMNVFVVKGVVGNLASLADIFRGVIIFLFADLLMILTFIIYPDILSFMH